MKRAAHIAKRGFAGFMALVMLLALAPSAAFAVGAAQSVDKRDLILSDSALTDAEKTIVKAFVAGDSVTYAKPDNTDGLVSVDTSDTTKKVTASDFDDGQGNTWTPVSAQVEYSGGDVADVTLSGGYGEFEYDGAESYAVKVTYGLYVNLDSADDDALRSSLASAAAVPGLLKSGLVKMAKVDDFKDDLSGFKTGLMPTLRKYVVDEGFARDVDGSTVYVRPGEGEAIRQGTQALVDHMDANGGDFALLVLMDGYTAKSNADKIAFLREHGQEVRDEIDFLYAQFVLLAQANLAVDYSAYLSDSAKADLNTLYDTLVSMRDSLAALQANDSCSANGDWDYLASAADIDAFDASLAAQADAIAATDIPASHAKPAFDASKSYAIDTAAVSVDVDQSTVDISITVRVTDTDNSVKEIKFEGSRTFVNDTARDDVLAEVEAFIKTRLGSIDVDYVDGEGNPVYNVYDDTAADGINTVNYKVTTRTDDIGASLVAAAAYTIVIEPQEFTYKINSDAAVTVPYGYTLTLAEHSNTAMAYDYEIDGARYYQGETYRILGNTTITRTEAKAYTSYGLGEIVGQDATLGLSADEIDILSSRALSTDVIRLRQPSEDDNLVDVEEVGGQLAVTAKPYTTIVRGVSGTYTWVPVAVTPIVGGSAGTAYAPAEDGGVYKVTLSETGVERVEVTYELELDNSAVAQADVQALLDLPTGLYNDATVNQLPALAKVNEVYSKLAKLDQESLNELKFAVKNITGLGDEAKAAVDGIITECVDPTARELYLKISMDGYRGQTDDPGRLAYYYNNSAIYAQLERLSGYLDTIAADPGLHDTLVKVKYEEYEDVFTETAAKLHDAAALLTQPDAHIVSGNENMLTLTTDILTGALSAHTANAALVLQQDVAKAAPGMLTYTLVLQSKDSAGNITDTKTYRVSRAAGNALGEDMASYITAFEAGLTGGAAHYNRDGDPANDPTAATVMGSADTTYTITWSPKEYAVTINLADGTADTKNITVLNPTVDLSAYTVPAGVRYDYYVDGDTTTAVHGNVSFAAPFEGHFIDQKSIDLSEEDMILLVDKLNQTTTEKLGTDVDGKTVGMASFVLAKDDSDVTSLVLRLSPKNTGDKTSAVAGIVQDIVGSGLDIYIGGELFWDVEASKLHVPALTNALLNSGSGITDIYNAVDSNGHIIEMSLDGTAKILNTKDNYAKAGDLGYLGGKLFTLDLQVGAAKKPVTLYVTLEDFGKSTDDLKSMIDNIDRLEKYMDAELTGGNIQLTLKSEKAYKAYLTSAAAAGYNDLDSFNAPDDVGYIEFLFEYVKQLIEMDDVTLTTYINTGKEIGTDLSEFGRFDKYYTKYVQKFARNLVDNSTKNTDGNPWGFTYNLNALLQKLQNKGGLPEDALNAVDEKDVDYGVKVVFPNRTYIALVADADASRTRILSYPQTVAELQSMIDEASANTVVILLEDITGDLNLGKNIVLDLNGKTLNGSVNSSASRAVIVDSDLNNDGTVTGSVSGGVKIVGGTFASDVSAFLANDYEQVGGKVDNGLYILSEDADGNIIVELNADRIQLVGFPTPKAVATELAFDLALNFYMASALEVDGNKFYDVDIDDIVHLVRHAAGADADAVIEDLDISAVNAFIATVIADMEDLANIQSAFAAHNGEIKSYDFKTWNWSFGVEKDGSEDKLNVPILKSSGDADRTGKIIIKAGGQDANQDEVAELLTELEKIITFNGESLVLDQPTRSGRTLILGGTAKGDVEFDMTKNPNYALGIGVILASGLKDSNPTAYDELKAGITEYVEHKSLTKLHQAFNNLKNSDLITAMSKYTRTSDFDAMVDSLSLGDDADAVKKLGNTYRAVLVTLGYAVRRSGAVGGGSLMSTYELADKSGWYELAKSGTKSYDRSIRSITVDATGKLQDGSKVTIGVFTDIFVALSNDDEATYYQEYYQATDIDTAFTAIKDGEIMRIFAAVKLTGNVDLSAKSITVRGADNLDLQGHTFDLGVGQEITLDKQFDKGADFTAPTGYMVDEKDNGDGTFTYSVIEQIIIRVTDKDGVVTTYNDASKIDEAFGLVKDGGKVEIFGAVTLGQNVSLNDNAVVTVEGAKDYLTVGSYTFDLGKGSSITFDTALPDENFTVPTNYTLDKSGKWTYTAIPIIIRATPDSGAATEYLDAAKIDEAFGLVKDGGKVEIFDDVTLTAGVTVNGGKTVTVEGADKLDLNGQKITLGEGSKLTIDKQLDKDADFTPVTGYHVKETDNGDGTYTYELEADPAVLIRATPDGGAATEYTDPADIDTAFALVKSGGTVDILGTVNGLTAGVTVDAGKTVTVTGATTNALDLNGQKITLGEGSKFTIDKQLDKDADFTAVTGYHVKETDNGDGTYTYELEADPAVLIRATPDNGAATEYTDPADIDTAFALVKSGGTVDILGAVNGLTAGVTVDAGKTVTVTGATTNALDLNGQKITLGEGSKLTIDKKLDKDADFTAVTGYHVKETDNGDGTYTYELEADEVPATPIIELYDDSNALVNTYYKASDIVTAFGAAKDGYTIKLLANVTLSDDVTIKAGDTVTLDVNGNTFTVASGKTITLQRDGAKKATLRSNQSLDASTQLAKKYADGSDDVYSEITSTADGAYTAYTLKALTPKTSISDIYTTNGKVSADNTNKIVSALFSNDTKLIILDVVDPVSLNKTIEGAQHAGNGITPLEFRVQVVYSDENVESKDIACTKADGTAIDNTKCIPTGAKVTITATNPDYTADNGGSSATYTYTVVVLGDTDCDGIISNADNVLMQNYYIDKEGKGLSGYALIAANVNRDSDTTMNSGSVDNNDKVQNLIKYWRPWDYKTHLTTSSAS